MAQTVVGNHALTVAEMPAHQHNVHMGVPGLIYMYYQGGSQGAPAADVLSDPAGGGQVHNHTISMSIQYIDMILASKN
jgi:hypothetical protein